MNSTYDKKPLSRGDFFLCLGIVLLVIVLHGASLPLATLDADVREEYRTEDGLPYLSEMDSYVYYRITEETADAGLSAYTLRHSRGDDPYIAANATGEEGDVVMGLPILGATVYKLLSWIPGITVYHVVYWLGPVLAALAAIPAYLFVRRRTNRLGGFAAGCLVAMAAPFAAHTHAGFYDTDMGLALLPCAFLLCYLEAILAKDLRRRAAWSVGSGLFLCALATFWRAYYAYFCIGLAAAGCALIAVALAAKLRKGLPGEDPRTPSQVLYGATSGLAAQLLCCLLVRGGELFADLGGIFGDVGGSLGNGDPAFPGAANFVSELQPMPTLGDEYNAGGFLRFLNGWAAYDNGRINRLGGWTVLLATLAIVAFLVVICVRAVFFERGSSGPSVRENDALRFLNDRCRMIACSVFLCVWLGCGVIILFKGARFLTIPVLPIGILCGLGVGLLYEWMTGNPSEADTDPVDEALAGKRFSVTLFKRVLPYDLILLSLLTFAFALRPEFGTSAALIAASAVLILTGIAFGVLGSKRIPKFAVLLFTLALVASPAMACFGFAYSATPDGSDSLQEMCDYIRENTPDDAVIGSWWDYGYFYEQAAQRLTLGDGGNFNSEWNYWLGQALMTENDALTKGIFRMLANGGLDATHLLMDALPSDKAAQATSILKQTLTLTRADARIVMTETYGLAGETADEVLALTHPETTRPIYLILSEDMLSKIGAIATYGYWNFGSNPEIPWIALSTSRVTIPEDASEVIVPLTRAGMEVRIRILEAGTLTAELRRTGTNDGFNTCCRVIRADGTNGEPPTEPVIDYTADAAWIEDLSDAAIPTFKSMANGVYTIYLREESPSCYTCLVCSSFCADSVLVRGFVTNGDALRYRDVRELTEANGTTKLHEVAVWELGR